MSDLLKKQFFFTLMVARLIYKAHELGFEIKLGQVLRSEAEAKENARRGIGIRNSLHLKALAVDIQLFKNGIYLTESEDYKSVGEWWEKQSTPEYNCTWGGRFRPKPDGNHFSIQHEGVK